MLLLRTFAVAVRRFFVFDMSYINISLGDCQQVFSIFFHSSQDEKIDKSSPKNDSFFVAFLLATCSILTSLFGTVNTFFMVIFSWNLCELFYAIFVYLIHCCHLPKMLLTLLLKRCLCRSITSCISIFDKYLCYFPFYYK